LEDVVTLPTVDGGPEKLEEDPEGDEREHHPKGVGKAEPSGNGGGGGCGDISKNEIINDDFGDVGGGCRDDAGEKGQADNGKEESGVAETEAEKDLKARRGLGRIHGRSYRIAERGLKTSLRLKTMKKAGAKSTGLFFFRMSMS
jgi:hypothetical protein